MKAEHEKHIQLGNTTHEISGSLEDAEKLADDIIDTQKYIAVLMKNISFYINKYRQGENPSDSLYRVKVLLSSALSEADELTKLIQSPTGKVIVDKDTSQKMLTLNDQLVIVKEATAYV
ncbi:MAG: hypothetical protein FWC20_01930 [Oscillospiraceae bacterium]|nr:hypothetical protein [Oscillospiraceae bacterium]MCL2278152.1 hypothetical protein [Oscillospiraceae bacterium]